MFSGPYTAGLVCVGTFGPRTGPIRSVSVRPCHRPEIVTEPCLEVGPCEMLKWADYRAGWGWAGLAGLGQARTPRVLFKVEPGMSKGTGHVHPKNRSGLFSLANSMLRPACYNGSGPVRAGPGRADCFRERPGLRIGPRASGPRAGLSVQISGPSR